MKYLRGLALIMIGLTGIGFYCTATEPDKVVLEEVTRAAELIHDSPLMKTPSHQSNIIQSLPSKAHITVLEREKAWYHIIAPDNIYGWVKMLNVRFLANQRRADESGISDLLSSVTQPTLPTVSTGVRGFEEEDLKNAQANFEQLALLEQYASDPQSANQFAHQAELETQEIDLAQGASK